MDVEGIQTDYEREKWARSRGYFLGDAGKCKISLIYLWHFDRVKIKGASKNTSLDLLCEVDKRGSLRLGITVLISPRARLDDGSHGSYARARLEVLGFVGRHFFSRDVYMYLGACYYHGCMHRELWEMRGGPLGSLRVHELNKRRAKQWWKITTRYHACTP